MVKKWTVECVGCGKKDNFGNEKDIVQLRWKILGWNIGTNTPICVCDKCEYMMQKFQK